MSVVCVFVLVFVSLLLCSIVMLSGFMLLCCYVGIVLVVCVVWLVGCGLRFVFCGLRFLFEVCVLRCVFGVMCVCVCVSCCVMCV